ncbi:hypothetical protein D3C72_1471560 [compost metagenome]
MILRGCAWMSRKRILSCSRPTARCVCSRPVILPSASQALTDTWPLVSGAKVRIISAASMAVSRRGRPWLTPGSATLSLMPASSCTSCSVFQLMPLPPLPSLSSSGPTEVNLR